MTEKAVQRRLAAILAADVASFLRLIDEDEIGTLERLKRLRTEFLHPKTEELGGLNHEFRLGILRVFGDRVESLAACLREAQHAGERNAGVDRLAAFFWLLVKGRSFRRSQSGSCKRSSSLATSCYTRS